MSEFYLIRRNSIADLSAFFGFLVGFLGSAPIAWPFLQVGFQTGEITKGFAYFISIICGAGVVCGAIGLLLGRAGGWVWERGHRFLRAHGPNGASRDLSRQGDARVVRDRAIVESLRGGAGGAAGSAVPGIRFDAESPDPAAYQELLRRAGVPVDDEAALERALRRTTNVAAWEGRRLVGLGRVLTDGHRYAALAELVVDPELRRRGIGLELVRRLRAAVPGPVSAMHSTSGCERFLDAAGVSRAGPAMTALVFLASLVTLPGDPLPGQSVRDSAGVRIVTYARGDRPLDVWRVDSVPILEIGGDGREGPTEFANVVGVARLSDGRFAVANAATHEIRVFDLQRPLRARDRASRPGPW